MSSVKFRFGNLENLYEFFKKLFYLKKEKNPFLKDDIIKQIKNQGYSFSKKQTNKKPIWYPRPQSKIDLSTGRTHLIVSEPRSEIIFGFDIQDKRIPITHISSKDDSIKFDIENLI